MTASKPTPAAVASKADTPKDETSKDETPAETPKSQSGNGDHGEHRNPDSTDELLDSLDDIELARLHETLGAERARRDWARTIETDEGTFL